MGNLTPNPEASSQIICKYWESIGPSLFRNKATQQVIRQRKMSFRTHEQMSYVFNCLLKRMNNYNSNVIKIVYLRKLTQPSSLFVCAERFTILVYIQNVEYTLEKFLKQRLNQISKKDQPFINNYDHKCICLHVLKGAQYLKQRHGSFVLSDNNVRIQFPKIAHLNSSIQAQISYDKNQARQQFLQNIRVKLWISTQQQQNFPDQSCQQRQMCLSVINLIRTSLIPNRLCKSYYDPKALTKYENVLELKQLAQGIKLDHKRAIDGNVCITQQNQLVKKDKTFPLSSQRTLRSFSSNEQVLSHTGNQVSNYTQKGFHHPQHNQRKYSLIQFGRKPGHKEGLYRTQRNMPQATPLVTEESISAAHKSAVKTPPIYYQQGNSIQPNNNPQVRFVSNKTYQERPQPKHIKKPTQHIHIQNGISLQHFQLTQTYNQKVKFRHGNGQINKPIIGIAGMSYIQGKALNISKQTPQFVGDNQRICCLLQVGNKGIEPRLDVYSKDRQLDSKERQLDVYSKEGQLDVHTKEIKIVQLEPASTDQKQGLIVPQKGLNLTERSRIQSSLKVQQNSAINTSRKNISITPISLNSTYGAGSSINKIIGISDNVKTLQQTNQQSDLGMLYHIVSKQVIQSKCYKKQSGSCSKSENGHYTQYQSGKNGELANQKILMKKRMSNQCEPSSLQSVNVLEQTFQIQKSHSFANKTQTLEVSAENNQVGRLRQSQYVMSGQNSFTSQKKEPKIESKWSFQILQNTQRPQNSKKLTSLLNMQAQYKTHEFLHDMNFLNQNPNTTIHQIIQNSAQFYKTQQKVSSRQLNQQNTGMHISFQSRLEDSNYIKQSVDFIDEQKIEAIQHYQSGKSFLSKKNTTFVVGQSQQSLKYPDQDKRHIEVKLQDSKKRYANIYSKKFSFPANNKLKIMKNKSLKEACENHNSKGQSQRQVYLMDAPIPLNSRKQSNKISRFRKTFRKLEIQTQINQKKNQIKKQAQNLLRLTTSGHQDNFIRQKVRSKKAEFAQLKNQMNSLLL